MSNETTTVVLVHGAFAESSSWDAVIARLQDENGTLASHGHQACAIVAVANPLRSLSGDAAYVCDVVRAIDGPIVLVGHSYGGMVITEAAAQLEGVIGLVYVAAFAPDTGESATDLSVMFPGSTLGEALTAYPVATGGNEFAIARDRFHHQFAADLPAERAALMAATQRPVTEAALSDALAAHTPAWKKVPSWFVFGDQDLNIPAELHRFGAQRAASVHTREIAGGSHALSVSQPDEVAQVVIEAIVAASLEPIA